MGTLFLLVIPALTGILGIYMIVSGNPRLLHSYHYATTPPEKLPALARAEGVGMIGLSVAIALIALDMQGWLTIAGIALFVASIAAMLGAIVYYNGGLVTFSGQVATGPFATMKPAWRLLIMGAVGAVVSLLSIAPGVYMIASGDVSMLHSYHYANVAAADLPRLATAEGACMIVLGVAIFLCMLAGAGMLGKRPFPRWSIVLMVAGVACLCIGLIGLLGFIIYFNGSLMGSATL